MVNQSPARVSLVILPRGIHAICEKHEKHPEVHQAGQESWLLEVVDAVFG
jgi:hypothetical protein